MNTSRWFRGLSAKAVWLVAALTAGCGGRSVPSGTDTSSHWLSACDEDDECPTGYDCLCGVCTRSCDEPRDCRDLDEDAVCASPSECGTSNICTLEDPITPGVEPGPCDGGECSSPSPVNPGVTSVAPNTAPTPTSGVNPPAPSGECAFLADLTSDNGKCLDQDARCEQFRAENKARTVLLVLEQFTTDSEGNEVQYTEAELAKRQECVVEWATDRQLQVDAGDGLVQIMATWGQIAPIAGSVGFWGYEVTCTGDCACHTLDEEECAADLFCASYTGRMVNHAWLCLEPPAMFECMPADSTCGDAFKFGRDETGTCWLFANDCYTERELEYSEEECGHDDRYVEAFSDETSCENSFACYAPLENFSLAFTEGSVGCECEYEEAQVCRDGFLFGCDNGRWWSGQDGICFYPYGRCDRVFDTLDECLAAGFDCHLGPDAESNPVCAVQWDSTERPSFSGEQCETMGGVVIDYYDPNVWVNMPNSAQSCELPLGSVTTADCQAVDGRASCSTEANTIFCQNDETPVTSVSDCTEGTGYCCVPDTVL